MSAKISVSKQGDIYRVPVDPTTMQPLHLGSYDDEPVGAFMQTCTSLQELRTMFPGREFNFLQAPARTEQAVGPLPNALRAQVDDMARKHGVGQGVAPKTRLVAVAAETMEFIPEGVVVGKVHPSNDARLLHAQEFLKRLTTAREYASKKNQTTLDIKIQAVKELIDEVFKA